MITIMAEQEHYCLLTKDGLWTVAERRAGKYHPLGNCAQPGVALDQPEAVVLFRKDRCYSEPAARRLLAEVAAEWRYIYEHLR
ncbi:MAG TPA: hypothetical protein VHS58_20440 [Acetobacteraceae bacterium]|nr:hypothetical protein [Acetobacteraceae bacterium]